MEVCADEPDSIEKLPMRGDFQVSDSTAASSGEKTLLITGGTGSFALAVLSFAL